MATFCVTKKLEILFLNSTINFGGVYEGVYDRINSFLWKIVTDKWSKEELKETMMDILDISSYIIKVFILPSFLFLIPYFILIYVLSINGSNIFNISLLTIFTLFFQ